jgi:acetaldehyde dehydrogenase
MRIGIVGSGLIGTDLLLKVQRHPALQLAGVAGIVADSPGLARARELGVTATAEGLGALLELEPELDAVVDATSAAAHRIHAPLLAERGVFCIDLTPAALGPAVVPDVNLDEHLGAPEVNLVTCGAQATVPVVAAVARVADVPYAEIVSTVASRSAGPGTRANIDEFTTATARSLETPGGAARGKALIVLNPAEPPITMRNAIHLRLGPHDADEVRAAIAAAVAGLQRYVPGYRTTAEPVMDADRVTVLTEVEGAGDHLPPYAGNLDVMTAAAVRVCEVAAGARAAR